MLHFFLFVLFTATTAVPTDLSDESDVQLFQDDLVTLQDPSGNSLALAGSSDATNPLMVGDDFSLFADSSSALPTDFSSSSSSSTNVELSGLDPFDLEEASCLPKDGGQPSSKLRAREGEVCVPTDRSSGQSPGGSIDDFINKVNNDGLFENELSLPEDSPGSLSGTEERKPDCLPQFPKAMCCENFAVLELRGAVEDFLNCKIGTLIHYCLESCFAIFLFFFLYILTFLLNSERIF